MKVRYRSPDGKARSDTAGLASPQDRSEFLKAARGRLGAKFEKRTEPTSVWYVGTGPIVAIVMTLWLGGLTAYAATGGFAGQTGATVGRRAGKAAMVRFVAETLGVYGSLGLSAAIIAGAVAWWVMAYRKRPNRQIVTVLGR